MSPELNWDYPHLAHIRDHLADVTVGACPRLVINIPAQHGKSQLVTIRYALWRLMRDPALRVAVTAYGQKLANRFSRAARRLAREQGFEFGDVEQADEWDTAAGGAFMARGMGAGITGNAVDLLVVDDPYKDAKQAKSPTYRDSVWEWWTDALMKRLSKDADVIVIHTRWHSDDMTGRLLAGGGWRHLKMKAIAEEDEGWRARGEPLCADLHPLSQLEAERAANPVSFVSMGQQEPMDLEGGFFKGLERIPILEVAPSLDQFERVVRAWDLASTEAQAGSDPDYLVGVLMGKQKGTGRYIVLDVVRVRVGPHAVRQVIRQTAEADGVRVPIYVEREGAASGKLVANEIVTQTLAGFAAHAVPPKGSKAERAEPWAAQIEAGNVSVVKNSQTKALLDEHRVFPNGAHDDVVDSCSLCLNVLARPGLAVVVGTYGGR